MADFNYQPFLDFYGIEYATEGKNVSPGNVNVRCPFCRDGDPSMHMGLSLEGFGWGCWRDVRHRGKDPARIVQALLGVSYGEAEKIVADGSPLTTSLDAMRKKLDRLAAAKPVIDLSFVEVEFPPEVKRITKANVSFIEYLRGRGFDGCCLELIERFNLHGCYSGRWANRVIFPIMWKGRMVGWTGRAIYPSMEPKYLTFPNDGTPKAVLFNDRPLLPTDHTLVVVEGPLDVAKFDLFGHVYGFVIRGLLGTAITHRQIALLNDFDPRIKKVIVQDADALQQSLHISSSVQHSIVRQIVGADDPGAMTREQVEQFLASLI